VKEEKNIFEFFWNFTGAPLVFHKIPTGKRLRSELIRLDDKKEPPLLLFATPSWTSDTPVAEKWANCEALERAIKCVWNFKI
jgi:hypothetical protein